MSGAGSFDSSNSERVIIPAEPMHLYALPACVQSHIASAGRQHTPLVLALGLP